MFNHQELNPTDEYIHVSMTQDKEHSRAILYGSYEECAVLITQLIDAFAEKMEVDALELCDCIYDLHTLLSVQKPELGESENEMAKWLMEELLIDGKLTLE